MKKLVLVSTYCDTEEKLRVFSENVNKIKNLGIDVMGIGPRDIHMPDSIISKCDFFFYTKENPLIQYPVIHYVYWFLVNITDKRRLMMQEGYANYDWASLYQIKKLFQFALTYDYEYFCNIIYDLDITKEMEEKLVGNETNIAHRRISPIDEKELLDSAHFLFLDREKLSLIEKEITYERFLDVNGMAEDHVAMWYQKFGIKYIDPPIRDKIYYWKDNKKKFDYEIHKDFKFFFGKNPQREILVGGENTRIESLSGNVRIVFYGFSKESFEKGDITAVINSKTYSIHPEEYLIHEFPVHSQEVRSFQINYKNETIDITDLYVKTNYNLLYYDDLL